MRKHLFTILGLGLIIGVVLILFYKGPQPVKTEVAEVTSTPPAEVKPPAKISSEQQMGDQILADYASPESDGQEDVKLFYHYLTNIFMLIKSRDSKQYAINEDLASFLLGKNNYKTPCVSADSHIFNEKGLIVDRWQTPIHIHTISNDRFEIRSAGPDRKIFSEDDFIWPPPEPNSGMDQ